MKLYTYGKCLMCLGTKKTWYNRQCPYCIEGRAIHEITKKTVMKYVVENLDETEKKELINLLSNSLEEEEEK